MGPPQGSAPLHATLFSDPAGGPSCVVTTVWASLSVSCTFVILFGATHIFLGGSCLWCFLLVFHPPGPVLSCGPAFGNKLQARSPYSRVGGQQMYCSSMQGAGGKRHVPARLALRLLRTQDESVKSGQSRAEPCKCQLGGRNVKRSRTEETLRGGKSLWLGEVGKPLRGGEA